MDTLGPALGGLLLAVRAKLIECERDVNVAFLAPGNTVAWDNCCDGEEGGGQLWVRVVSDVPRPQPTQPCLITSVATRVGVGIVRCVHGLDNDGNPPTADEQSADTLQITEDADITFWGIQAWEPFKRMVPKSLVVEQGLPLGPEGYCAGWEWTLTFQRQLCSGCPPSGAQP